MSKNFYQRFRLQFDLNKDIDQIFINIFLENKINHDNDPIKGILVYTIAKTLKTHKGLLYLCKIGYGEDAAILLRTLFSILVNFFYIRIDDTKSRAETYIAHGIYAKKQYLDITRKWPMILKTKKLTPKTTAEIDKEAEWVVKKYNFVAYKPWHKSSLRKMAKELDKARIYKKPVFEMNYDIVYNLPPI